MITPSEAADLHYANRECLPMWTITANPSDCPGRYVARLHLTLPAPVVTNQAMVADTLHELRAMLPPGLICFQRDPSDDPVIVETWL